MVALKMAVIIDAWSSQQEATGRWQTSSCVLSLVPILIFKPPKFARANPGPALERSNEVRQIAIAQPPGNLGQGHRRILQKSLSILESYALKQTRKGRAALGESAL